MYQALLTNRYLSTRIIPFIAVAAVALCVALVIIVVSVMSGFLDMVRASGKTLMGDVVIGSGTRGIPYYDRLIEQLKQLPEVAAATPLVESYGTLRMPYESNEAVQFWGIEPQSFAEVTGYEGTLIWRTLTPEQLEWLTVDAPHHGNPRQALDDALTLTDSRTNRPGIVMGVYISDGNKRQRDGTYRPIEGPQGPWQWMMPRYTVTLSTLPLTGGLDVAKTRSVILPVINEFSSGIFLIDDKRVFIPLGLAQEMLGLNEGDLVNENTLDETGMPKVVGIDPARAMQVLVRAAPGITPAQLRDIVESSYSRFVIELENDPQALVKPLLPGLQVSIKTWEQQQAAFLGPIEKERELMRTLFSIVYLVCAGLVLAIFWAIVYEKTRDIGILRSIGASRAGVVAIFLRYGLVIGVIGAIVGFALGWLVVSNINSIHEAMGEPPLWLVVLIFALAAISLFLTIRHSLRGQLLPLVLGSIITLTLLLAGAGVIAVRSMGGIVVWDPTVYLFTRIPNTIDTGNAVTTMIFAVIFSLIGALLPAAKAADTDPVKALRYE